MALTQPLALWLLAAIPLVWIAYAWGRTNFNRRQRILQAVVRSLILAVLALAIARPLVATTSSRRSVVYAVDVSHSISTAAIEEAARQIDAINGALRPHHHRILVFGRTSASVTDTDALRRLARAPAEAAEGEVVDRGGTDLEAALIAARAELAAGHVPELVLFTDGRSTAGDLPAAAAQLAASGIPVSVEPLLVRTLPDSWIERLELPDRIAAGAPFQATVIVGSARNADAAVELHAGAKLVARQTVRLVAGTTSVAMDATIDEPGSWILRAALVLEGDRLAANNTLEHSVTAGPRTRVLYLEGSPGSARYLSSALEQNGFDVTTRGPEAFPTSADALDAWDAVVLSDVPRAAMGEAAMRALTTWVEARGGGLLVAGGESVFGEKGYRESPLEGLTPVTFERKDEPEVALVLVLDRSWSMAGPSMALCKAAAQAAVDVLADEHSIGILTFNDSFNWDVTLRNVGANREGIRRRIAAIGPAGHTLIYPAIEQAYLALRDVKARAKHVVLLSDGRSYPAEYEELLRRMVDARITMSSVAVGPGADPELLANLAKWGRGRYYAVSEPRELPQIFVKEAKDAATPAFDERAIKPVVRMPGFLAGVDLSRVPPLKGRTATVLKDTALEILATDEEDPLLAFWPIGLGRTAVFASDVKDRWGAEWIRWRGYGPFFSAVVRAVERRSPPPLSLELLPGPIRGDSRHVVVALEARDPSGGYRNLLRPEARITSPGVPAATARLRQVAPGRYEATVVADASQRLDVTAGDAQMPVSAALIPDPFAEYRFRAPDEAVLKGLASSTGGAWRPTAAALAGSGIERTPERRPMATPLIVLGLALWYVDLILRRVRVFEGRRPQL